MLCTLSLLSFFLSKWWFHRFKSRENVHLVKQRSEAASEDTKAALTCLGFSEKLWKNAVIRAQPFYKGNKTRLFSTKEAMYV